MRVELCGLDVLVFISVRPDSEGFAFFSELVWNQFSAHRGGEVEVPLQFSQVSLMVRVRAASSPLSKPRVARRRPRHSVEYKMMVVRAALRRPEEARVKPTCRYKLYATPVTSS